ncbi:flagellar biosynthesis anti-sigma factor FlgM [Desulfovibrio sp. OttesenSCG-928-O18]|nr:flagellar biosynthesis anti-sigma factor FlgM [Desulfovibrio sp. OttesenSCG-928-O18]
MEIKNNLNPLDPYSRTKLTATNNQAPQRAAQGVSAPQGETGDRVSLSPEAKLRTEAFTSAMSAPNVRAEKVAALKAQVESGEYTPDSKAIAAKLLAEEPGIFQP